jgi:hypothetical protein
MIESLVTSKTRVKLLFKFFINCEIKSYLRSLENEFGESSNSIRIELNRLEKSGLLSSSFDSNRKMYFANTAHPLFNEISNSMRKDVGIDYIIKHFTIDHCNLQAIYVTGDIAIGRDSKIIDLALVGENINRPYMHSIVDKTKSFINREIKFIILTKDELIRTFNNQPLLLIWKTANE